MELHATSATDTGRVRTRNEDTVLADLPLIAVADGMGGHNAGDVASSLALEKLAEWKEQLSGLSGREATQKLREAFGDINRAVYDKGLEDESLSGMGTTLTAGWVEGGTLALAHVGDSRAYLLRGNTLSQLTEDQSLVQEWVKRGRISEEEAARSPQRHVVLQAIGGDTDPLDIETSNVALHPGDRIVLASDGLFGMLRENERLRDLLMQYPDRDEACQALIEAANAAGGEDNISVVIVDVEGDPSSAGADVDEVPAPVVERDEPPPATAADPTTRSRFPRSLLVAGGAVVLVAVMALVFVVARPSSSLIVASRGEDIVILEGRVGDGNAGPTGEVLHTFANVKTWDFAESTQRELAQRGFEVESLDEAQELVEQLPKFLGPQDTPTPEPKDTPKPTADSKTSPEPKETAAP